MKESNDFLVMFFEQLKNLLTHFISKEQSRYFQSVEEDLKNGEVLVISDFAKNYTFIVQVRTKSNNN